MLETLTGWHGTVNGWVWGPVTMILLMGTGVYLPREFAASEFAAARPPR